MADMSTKWEGLKHAVRSRIKTMNPRDPYGKDVELSSPDFGGKKGSDALEGYQRFKELGKKAPAGVKTPTPEESGRMIKESLQRFKQQRKQ